MSSTKIPPGYIEASSPASTRSWSAADVTHTPNPDQGAALRVDLAAAIKRAEAAEALAAALQAEAEAGVALVVARAEAAERDGETWRGFAGSVAITVHGPATGGVITNHLAVDDLPDLLGAVEQLRARAEAAESERDALRAIVETAVHHLSKSVPYFGNAETLTYSIIAINVRNNLAAALGGVHQSEQADAHVHPAEGA